MSRLKRYVKLFEELSNHQLLKNRRALTIFAPIQTHSCINDNQELKGNI